MHARAMFEMQQSLVSTGWRGMALAGLEPDDVRRQPPAQNSLAWLMWHVARWQDVIASSWLAERAQVFDGSEFGDRLGAGTRHVGTGMTLDEVAGVSRLVDLDTLMNYWDAVVTRTSEVVAGLTDDDYERIVPDSARTGSTIDGAYGDARTAVWLDGFLANKTVGWFVMFLPFHMSEHIGEALSVRGQLGLNAPA